jgi:hypothetical protein
MTDAIDIGTDPFDEYRNAEITPPDRYVEIFSDILVKPCIKLFRPGNVIIQGIEGSGKSMLLNLLKPETRVEYQKKGISFPIPKKDSKFISAGLNISRSRLFDVGRRMLTRAKNIGSVKDAPLFFADFINIWLVRDLLNTIHVYRKELENSDLFDLVGIDWNDGKEQVFLQSMKESSSWLGMFESIDNYKDLQNVLTNRINIYRRIVTTSYPKPFPEDLHESLTETGEPISQTVEALYYSEILCKDTPVIMRIDQYEELLADNGEIGAAHEYREVIHKFLWNRDPNISYKIGTRKYAIAEQLNVYGLGGIRLEEGRNYELIDMDELLRRKEPGYWLFKRFAEDVFNKRLARRNYPIEPMNSYFGSLFSADIKARRMIVSSDSRSRALGKMKTIDSAWADFLSALAMGSPEASHYSNFCGESDNTDCGDPLSAKLGMAWYLQSRDRGIDIDMSHYFKVGEEKKPEILPWNKKSKQWWRKERKPQALLQLSAGSAQRTIWAGKSDILLLSGNNVMIFLDICSAIWRNWSENQTSVSRDDFLSRPIIGENYQRLGCYAASELWYRNIASRTDGDVRRKFIDKIGDRFYQKLKDDIKMTYPGHNGFSLSLSDYKKSEVVKEALDKAARYGDLVALPHTPKNSSMERRMKWYLLPILSPHFNLPAAHTKEPYYVKVSEVQTWVNTQ